MKHLMLPNTQKAILDALRALTKNPSDTDAQAAAMSALVTFDCDEVDQESLSHYVAAAQSNQESGVLEVDNNASVSIAEKNGEINVEGAYVSAWLWVSNDELEKS